jgi:NADH-quinone oxidoreductase subunit E
MDEININPGETTDDGKFSLDEVACLGCCSLAPVIMINDKVYGNLDDKKLRKVLKGY